MISFASHDAVKAGRTEGTVSGGGATFRTSYLTPEFPADGDGVFPLPQAFSIFQTPASISLSTSKPALRSPKRDAPRSSIRCATPNKSSLPMACSAAHCSAGNRGRTSSASVSP